MAAAIHPLSRYAVVNPELVHAAILPRDPQSPGTIFSELRELAASAAILLVTGPPELRYQCRVLLKSHRFRPTLLLPAEIHWARPNPAGDWLLGCRFDAPIDEAVFREVIESGVLNRRSSVRERSRIPAQVQLQPGKGRVTAIISDFSEGGLCLTLPGTVVPECNRHVCVYGVVDGEEVRIPLKLRWSLSVGPNRMVGCQFMRQADYPVLRKLHQATQNEPLTSALRPAGGRPSEIVR